MSGNDVPQGIPYWIGRSRDWVLKNLGLCLSMPRPHDDEIAFLFSIAAESLPQAVSFPVVGSNAEEMVIAVCGGATFSEACDRFRANPPTKRRLVSAVRYVLEGWKEQEAAFPTRECYQWGVPGGSRTATEAFMMQNEAELRFSRLIARIRPRNIRELEERVNRERKELMGQA